MDGVVGIARAVCEARYESEGRGGAGAAVLNTEFGGGNGVLGFGDGIHLWDDDRSTSVEGEADSGVVVSWNTGFSLLGMAEQRCRVTYRTQGMVRPSLIKDIS